MLRPVLREHSFLTPEDLGDAIYQRLCNGLGLPANDDGYGLLHSTNGENGKRITLIINDPDWLRLWIFSGEEATAINIDGDMRPATRWNVDQPEMENYMLALRDKVVAVAEGWPDEWIKPASSQS